MPSRRQRKEAYRKKQDAIEREQAKEAEVQAALERAEKTWSDGGSIPLQGLDGSFSLYSADYVGHCYLEYHLFRYIDLRYFDEDYQIDRSGLRRRDGKSLLEGHMYLSFVVDIPFEPFLPPLEASSEPFTTKANGEHTLAVQIIDDDHLIIRASRECVFTGWPKAKGPETYVFMGIRNQAEREIAKRMAATWPGRPNLCYIGGPLLGPTSPGQLEGDGPKRQGK